MESANTLSSVLAFEMPFASESGSQRVVKPSPSRGRRGTVEVRDPRDTNGAMMTDATDPRRNTHHPDPADLEGNYTEFELPDGTEAAETGGAVEGEYTDTDFRDDEEE
jgi:hypothetical protein